MNTTLYALAIGLLAVVCFVLAPLVKADSAQFATLLWFVGIFCVILSMIVIGLQLRRGRG